MQFSVTRCQNEMLLDGDFSLKMMMRVCIMRMEALQTIQIKITHTLSPAHGRTHTWSMSAEILILSKGRVNLKIERSPDFSILSTVSLVRAPDANILSSGHTARIVLNIFRELAKQVRLVMI